MTEEEEKAKNAAKAERECIRLRLMDWNETRESLMCALQMKEWTARVTLRDGGIVAIYDRVWQVGYDAGMVHIWCWKDVKTGEGDTTTRMAVGDVRPMDTVEMIMLLAPLSEEALVLMEEMDRRKGL